MSHGDVGGEAASGDKPAELMLRVPIGGLVAAGLVPSLGVLVVAWVLSLVTSRVDDSAAAAGAIAAILGLFITPGVMASAGLQPASKLAMRMFLAQGASMFGTLLIAVVVYLALEPEPVVAGLVLAVSFLIGLPNQVRVFARSVRAAASDESSVR